jgi:hypothetical protein
VKSNPVRREVSASPDDVADVLRNGWLYASWVVGANRIHGVDAEWPQGGTSIAHSVGVWPLVISDTTTSLLDDLPRRLELRARAWPVGEAHVVITIDAGDRPERSVVSMSESATAGPAALTPRQLEQPLIRLRNAEALRRLAMIAEGRSAARAE